MIGFYDYTVLLTLLSLLSSIFGMTAAMDGHFRLAIGCLAVSGLLDAFDGKVARTKQNRTEHQKLYGIELDSLCDMVCFGAFPAMICYLMGVRGILGDMIIGIYCLCGLIRLAYFNVLEISDREQPSNGRKDYHGLPITSIAVILPLTFLLGFLVGEQTFHIILKIMLLTTALCFVLNFRVKKPSNLQLIGLIMVVACAVVTIGLFSRQRVARQHCVEKPLYEQLAEIQND